MGDPEFLCRGRRPEWWRGVERGRGTRGPRRGNCTPARGADGFGQAANELRGADCGPWRGHGPWREDYAEGCEPETADFHLRRAIGGPHAEKYEPGWGSDNRDCWSREECYEDVGGNYGPRPEEQGPWGGNLRPHMGDLPPERGDFGPGGGLSRGDSGRGRSDSSRWRGDSGPGRGGSGPWRDDSGPRRDDSGPRRDDSGPRRDDSGPRRDDSGPRRDDIGPGRGDSGPWRDDSGPWRDDSGPWRDDSGPWRDDSGPWRDDCGPGRGDCGPGRGGRGPWRSDCPGRSGSGPWRGDCPGRGGSGPGRGDCGPGRGDCGPGRGDCGPGRGDCGPGRGDCGPGRGDCGPGRGDCGPGRGDCGPGRGGPGRGDSDPGRGGRGPWRGDCPGRSGSGPWRGGRGPWRGDCGPGRGGRGVCGQLVPQTNPYQTERRALSSENQKPQTGGRDGRDHGLGVASANPKSMTGDRQVRGHGCRLSSFSRSLPKNISVAPSLTEPQKRRASTNKRRRDEEDHGENELAEQSKEASGTLSKLAKCKGELDQMAEEPGLLKPELQKGEPLNAKPAKEVPLNAKPPKGGLLIAEPMEGGPVSTEHQQGELLSIEQPNGKPVSAKDPNEGILSAERLKRGSINAEHTSQRPLNKYSTKEKLLNADPPKTGLHHADSSKRDFLGLAPTKGGSLEVRNPKDGTMAAACSKERPRNTDRPYTGLSKVSPVKGEPQNIVTPNAEQRTGETSKETAFISESQKSEHQKELPTNVESPTLVSPLAVPTQPVLTEDLTSKRAPFVAEKPTVDGMETRLVAPVHSPVPLMPHQEPPSHLEVLNVTTVHNLGLSNHNEDSSVKSDAIHRPTALQQAFSMPHHSPPFPSQTLHGLPAIVPRFPIPPQAPTILHPLPGPPSHIHMLQGSQVHPPEFQVPPHRPSVPPHVLCVRPEPPQGFHMFNQSMIQGPLTHVQSLSNPPLFSQGTTSSYQGFPRPQVQQLEPPLTQSSVIVVNAPFVLPHEFSPIGLPVTVSEPPYSTNRIPYIVHGVSFDNQSLTTPSDMVCYMPKTTPSATEGAPAIAPLVNTPVSPYTSFRNSNTTLVTRPVNSYSACAGKTRKASTQTAQQSACDAAKVQECLTKPGKEGDTDSFMEDIKKNMQALWPDANNCLTSSSRSQSPSSSGSPRRRSRSVTPDQWDICSLHSNGPRSFSRHWSRNRSLRSRSRSLRSRSWSRGRSLRSRGRSRSWSRGRSRSWSRGRSRSWSRGRSRRRSRGRSLQSRGRSLQSRGRSLRSRSRSLRSRSRSLRSRDRSRSRSLRSRRWSPRSRSPSPIMPKRRKSAPLKKTSLRSQNSSVAVLDIPMKKTSKKLLHSSKKKRSVRKKSSRAPDVPRASGYSRPSINRLSACSSKCSKGTSLEIRPQSSKFTSENFPPENITESPNVSHDSSHSLLKTYQSEHSSTSRKCLSLNISQHSSLSSSPSHHITLEKTVMSSDLSPALNCPTSLLLSKNESKSKRDISLNIELHSSFSSTGNAKHSSVVTHKLSAPSGRSRSKTISSLEASHQASCSFETARHLPLQKNSMPSKLPHVCDCLPLNQIKQQSSSHFSMNGNSSKVDNASMPCSLSQTSSHSALKTDKLSGSSSKSRTSSSEQQTDGQCYKSSKGSNHLLLEQKNMSSNRFTQSKKPTSLKTRKPSTLKTSHRDSHSLKSIVHLPLENNSVLSDLTDDSNCLPLNAGSQQSLNDPEAWIHSLLSKNSMSSNLSKTSSHSPDESLVLPHSARPVKQSLLKRSQISQQSRSSVRREDTTQKSAHTFQTTGNSVLEKKTQPLPLSPKSRKRSLDNNPRRQSPQLSPSPHSVSSTNCSLISKSSMSSNVAEAASHSATIVSLVSPHSSKPVKQSRLERRSKSHHGRSKLKKRDTILKSGHTFPVPGQSLLEKKPQPLSSEAGRQSFKINSNQQSPHLSQSPCSASSTDCSLWRDRCKIRPVTQVHSPSDSIPLTAVPDNEQNEEEYAAEPSETCFSMEDFLSV